MDLEFEAWDKVNKRMYYNFQVDSQLGVCCNIALPTHEIWEGKICVDPKDAITIRQFINKVDCENNKLFQYDIVKVFFEDEEQIGIIEWHEDYACWCIYFGENNCHYPFESVFENGINVLKLGNKFENPELLEGK